MRRLARPRRSSLALAALTALALLAIRPAGALVPVEVTALVTSGSPARVLPPAPGSSTPRFTWDLRDATCTSPGTPGPIPCRLAVVGVFTGECAGWEAEGVLYRFDGNGVAHDTGLRVTLEAGTAGVAASATGPSGSAGAGHFLDTAGTCPDDATAFDLAGSMSLLA